MFDCDFSSFQISSTTKETIVFMLNVNFDYIWTILLNMQCWRTTVPLSAHLLVMFLSWDAALIFFSWNYGLYMLACYPLVSDFCNPNLMCVLSRIKPVASNIEDDFKRQVFCNFGRMENGFPVIFLVLWYAFYILPHILSASCLWNLFSRTSNYFFVLIYSIDGDVILSCLHL